MIFLIAFCERNICCEIRIWNRFWISNLWIRIHFGSKSYCKENNNKIQPLLLEKLKQYDFPPPWNPGQEYNYQMLREWLLRLMLWERPVTFTHASWDLLHKTLVIISSINTIHTHATPCEGVSNWRKVLFGVRICKFLDLV